ncbi:MAG: 30S ribosome-binding factor RbfA [Calditrichaceae bacterium]
MAQQRRQDRYSGALKKALGSIIDLKVKDPEKGMITLTNVKISPDLKIASVYYTVLGDDEQKEKTARALKRSASFIRNELRPIITARWLPELRFFYDESIEYAARINSLLKKIENDSDSEKK